jgi:ferritin
LNKLDSGFRRNDEKGRFLEDKVKKVEAEVVDLREVIRKAISQEVDLDELAASIVSHAVTEEDSTEIIGFGHRLSH